MTEQTQPTDAEIDGMVAAYLGDCGPQATRVYSFARAVLAKWGQPVVSGEPVAVIEFTDGVKEPRIMSWNALPVGQHRVYTTPQPTHAADSVQRDALDAARWQDHVGKLDALVAYCPTCCQGFIAKQDMTRDEVLFACGKAVGQSGAKRLGEALDLAVDHIDMDALRISHCKDAAAIDAARKQGGA